MPERHVPFLYSTGQTLCEPVCMMFVCECFAVVCLYWSGQSLCEPACMVYACECFAVVCLYWSGQTLCEPACMVYAVSVLLLYSCNAGQTLCEHVCMVYVCECFAAGIFVLIHIHIYGMLHLYRHTYMRICWHDMRTCVHIYDMHACRSPRYVCIYVYMRVCMYACMHAHV